MNTLTRLGLGIITAALTAAALATTPPASAATITVSPGDRVDYVSPEPDAPCLRISGVRTVIR